MFPLTKLQYFFNVYKVAFMMHKFLNVYPLLVTQEILHLLIHFVEVFLHLTFFLASLKLSFNL
jgi:hypothetical protein